ncbi:MAG: YqhA family protein [Chlorobiaceae bacterium]|nr:YqhA family protein [Chlorobiaceae bacterium]
MPLKYPASSQHPHANVQLLSRTFLQAHDLSEEYSLLRLPERSAAADNPFSLHCRSRDSWASTCLNRIGNARSLLSLGLYELFIDDSIALPEWLVMHTPDDLKEKPFGFIVVGLAADFPGHAITWTPPFFRCSRKKPPATKKRDRSLQNNFPVIIRFSPVFSLPVIIRIY